MTSKRPDGSRTMRAFTDIFARNVTANVVLRADAAFVPVDAFVSIYTQGRLKGFEALAQLGELFRLGQGHGLGLVAHDLLHQQVEVVAGREGHHLEALGELQGDLQGLGAD